MTWILLILLFCASNYFKIEGFTVDVVNFTRCSNFDEELGELKWDIGSEETVDQLFSGTFRIPVELTEDAYVYYESYFWNEKEKDWIFIFDGVRTLCSSILMSLPYRKFRTSVEPNWPEKCPIPAGKYDLENFPISGQYAVLSDIQHLPPLVRHELRLWQDDDLVFCRIVYTLTDY